MKEPALSPVGSGLYQYPSLVQPAAFPKGGPRGKHSLWSDDRADFYHDPRALSVGDIVTVRINIKDEASLRNATDRTRESKVGAGLSLAGALGEWVLPDVGVDLEADGKSDAKGAGRISRSEDIKLSVAAVVTQELVLRDVELEIKYLMGKNFHRFEDRCARTSSRM